MLGGLNGLPRDGRLESAGHDEDGHGEGVNVLRAGVPHGMSPVRAGCRELGLALLNSRPRGILVSHAFREFSWKHLAKALG